MAVFKFQTETLSRRRIRDRGPPELADICNRAAYGRERVAIERHSKACVQIGELAPDHRLSPLVTLV